ncbi:MAG: hypothetical protein Q9159_006393 [Coniocarpon cinnabarinum]
MAILRYDHDSGYMLAKSSFWSTVSLEREWPTCTANVPAMLPNKQRLLFGCDINPRTVLLYVLYGTRSQVTLYRIPGTYRSRTPPRWVLAEDDQDALDFMTPVACVRLPEDSFSLLNGEWDGGQVDFYFDISSDSHVEEVIRVMEILSLAYIFTFPRVRGYPGIKSATLQS